MPHLRDPSKYVYQDALTLIRAIDDMQTAIGCINLELDWLAWHTFSVAFVASDPDPDTKPLKSELKTLERQIDAISNDIATIYPHISAIEKVFE